MGSRFEIGNVMDKKIYFTGSIRGGRNDALLYQELIEYIQKSDQVLTEHIGTVELSTHEYIRNEDEMIYQRDIAWIKECDILIAECTSPSLGVGYELAYAENLGKECHIFYCKDKCHFSAMLNGNKYFHVHPYKTKEELLKSIDIILEKK